MPTKVPNSGGKFGSSLRTISRADEIIVVGLPDVRITAVKRESSSGVVRYATTSVGWGGGRLRGSPQECFQPPHQLLMGGGRHPCCRIRWFDQSGPAWAIFRGPVTR